MQIPRDNVCPARGTVVNLNRRAARDILFIGAGLGSKGSTLDLKVANHTFSTISGDVPVSRSLVQLLGSDQ